MKYVFVFLPLVFLCGCAWSGNESARAGDKYSIVKNPRLTNEETQFAIRLFEIGKKLALASEPPLSDEAMQMSPAKLYDMLKQALGNEKYKKWVVEKKTLSSDERIYLLQLPQMVEIWQSYNSIDMDKLTAKEKTFLQSMHTQYGKGSVNLRAEITRQHGKLNTDQERYFDLVEAFSGSQELNDHALVFYYKMLPK